MEVKNQRIPFQSSAGPGVRAIARLQSASKLKAESQALRPAPASLSFYPAEKKVSKENGGHGMEHFLCEVF